MLTQEADAEGASLGQAVLTIRDQGIGIPLVDLPSVFEPFHRAGNVGSVSGTGVGLAGVKQIVEQHGGSVVAESTEGVGSTFSVRLPLISPALDEEHEDEAGHTTPTAASG
jgi:signal transduction histidine kinase